MPKRDLSPQSRTLIRNSPVARFHLLDLPENQETTLKMSGVITVKGLVNICRAPLQDATSDSHTEHGAIPIKKDECIVNESESDGRTHTDKQIPSCQVV